MIFIVEHSGEWVCVYKSGLSIDRFREWCQYKGWILIGYCEGSCFYTEEGTTVEMTDDQNINAKLDRHREVEEHNKSIIARIKELYNALPPHKHASPQFYGLLHVIDSEKQEMAVLEWSQTLEKLKSEGYIPSGIDSSLGYVFKHVDFDKAWESQRQEREELNAQLWTE